MGNFVEIKDFKNFVVEITLVGNPYNELIVVRAKDELDAIDKARKYYVNSFKKEIIDIKVV